MSIKTTTRAPSGITESIINNLTQLPNLRVIARSSVFRYKGRETDPLAVGKELGVRAVLTGRLMQRGEKMLISAELIDIRDNKQLWGEQYERPLADMLSVQREIAREKGYEERDFRLIMITVSFEFDNIRTDPRFRELVRRMGLPE